MAADATLVAAAYRASMANVPADYSTQFQTMVDAHKTLLTGVKDAFTAYKLEKQAGIDKLNEGIKDVVNTLSTVKIGADHDQLQDKIEEQKEIFERDKLHLPRTARARQDWDRENQKIIASIQGNQTSLIDGLQKWESGKVHKKGMSTGEIINGEYSNDVGVLNNLLDYAKNVGDKSGVHNKAATEFMSLNDGSKDDKTKEDLWDSFNVKEDEKGLVVKYLDPVSGEYTYITKIDGNVITKKSSEIEKMMPDKDTDGQTGVLEIVNLQGTNSQKTDQEYSAATSTMNKNQLSDLVDDRLDINKHALKFMMAKKYGPQEKSFEDAIRSGEDGIGMSDAIVASLQGVTGFENDGDDKFEREDFAAGEEGTKNYNAVVQSILQGKENPELSRDLFVNYTDETAFKKMWNTYKLPKKGTTPPTETYGGGVETIGGVKYGFENEATTEKGRGHRIVAKAVLNKDKEVFVPGAGWFDLIEKGGKTTYQSREENLDDKDEGTGEYDTWTRDQFLKQFATTQVPIEITSGTKVIEYKPEGDLALTKPNAKEYVEGQKDELGQKITPPPNRLENLVWNSTTKSWITVFQYGG